MTTMGGDGSGWKPIAKPDGIAHATNYLRNYELTCLTTGGIIEGHRTTDMLF